MLNEYNHYCLFYEDAKSRNYHFIAACMSSVIKSVFPFKKINPNFLLQAKSSIIMKLLFINYYKIKL